MLTHVLLNRRDELWVAEWLQGQFPEETPTFCTDDAGCLCVEVGDRRQKWTPAHIVDVNRTLDPTVAVPFLYTLSRLYDDRQETADLLRQRVKERFGVDIGPVCFYWEKSRPGALAATQLEADNLPDDASDIQVLSTTAWGEVCFCLPPSVWLRDILVQHLEARAV